MNFQKINYIETDASESVLILTDNLITNIFETSTLKNILEIRHTSIKLIKYISNSRFILIIDKNNSLLIWDVINSIKKIEINFDLDITNVFVSLNFLILVVENNLYVYKLYIDDIQTFIKLIITIPCNTKLPLILLNKSEVIIAIQQGYKSIIIWKNNDTYNFVSHIMELNCYHDIDIIKLSNSGKYLLVLFHLSNVFSIFNLKNFNLEKIFEIDINGKIRDIYIDDESNNIIIVKHNGTISVKNILNDEIYKLSLDITISDAMILKNNQGYISILSNHEGLIFLHNKISTKIFIHTNQILINYIIDTSRNGINLISKTKFKLNK